MIFVHRGVARSAALATFITCGALALVVPSALARRPPEVVTKAATEVESSHATFNGVVTPHGNETTYFFQYGATDFDSHTPLVAAGSGREPVAVTARVETLTPETTYRVRLVAFNDRRVTTGDAVAFETQPAQPPTGPPVSTHPLSPAGDASQVLVVPPPVLGERVNVTVRSGTVSVRAPGHEGFVRLAELASVPVGSLVNTRHGSVILRTARPNGGSQSGIFHGGLFEVRQRTAAGGLTELILRGRRATCRQGRASGATASARRRRPRRALWGNVRRGNFRLRGDHSVATVRGTVWNVQDRCDGTLTRVRRGSVFVRDLRRHRTVVVRAGGRYLARPRR